jgi:hypothetical protein
MAEGKRTRAITPKGEGLDMQCWGQSRCEARESEERAEDAGDAAGSLAHLLSECGITLSACEAETQGIERAIWGPGEKAEDQGVDPGLVGEAKALLQRLQRHGRRLRAIRLGLAASDDA